MSRVGDRLTRALRDAAAAGGVVATLGPLASRRWHSALFSGEVHAASLTGADDEALATWLAGLPEIELSVPGHVTDVRVAATTRHAGWLTAALELQTIET